MTAIVNIRDRAAVLEEINKLRTVEKKIAKDSKNPDKEPSTGEQDTIATVQFAGQEVYYYSGGDRPGVPCWCVTEHEFVVALNIPSIKAFLNRRNHQSLATSSIVSRIISGQEKPLALGYLDTPKLFELFYPFVTMATPGTARAMGGKKAGIDPSFWPSATAISRHLQSETTTIQRTSDGFESTTHYFVPWVGNVAEYFISLSLPLADILPEEYVPFVSPPYPGPIMRPIADGGKPAPPPEQLKPKQPTSPPEPRYSPTFPPPALQPKDK